MALEEFGLRLQSDWVTPSHRCFRPPSWPPPRDWVVSEDKDGNILSRWGDPVWNLTPWAGKLCFLRFGDGRVSARTKPIDPANADLLRLLTTWRMWGPRAAATTASLKNNFFGPIRRIVELCSREHIRASELMRFPRVLEQVPGIIMPSLYENAIAELHRLWDARDQIGFVLVDEHGMKRLAGARPDHETKQTAYIPPRIWTYQVQRLRECLDDFLAHRQQVKDCFNFCVDSYARNYGSLRAAMTSKPIKSRLPFGDARTETGARTGYLFHGPFGLTAERFGIRGLLERWALIPNTGLDLPKFSRYLTLIQYVGLAYIANFTLQRINEAASLRADCLVWEEDPELGRVPIICGETTKTDPDSDARWPTSPSVEVAVAAMASVARLRMRCAVAHSKIGPAGADQANPYLFCRAFEPWTGGRVHSYTTRHDPRAYKNVLNDNPRLFDADELRTTEEDLKIARMLTPTLSKERGFAVGEQWPLAWHQLRRTSAVNMFASGLLSDSSLQFQMKHSSRLMPLYYGRGYTKLHLNEEVEGVVMSAMYEAMAQSLLIAKGDRFVSPHSPERKQAIVVNLIGQKDAQTLAAAAKRGQLFFRENRLGGCMQRGVCEYGGVESIARCAGGDGYAPCADALYDRLKAPAAEKELMKVDQELARLPAGSPRHKALLAERKGLENFLNVVRS